MIRFKTNILIILSLLFLVFSLSCSKKATFDRSIKIIVSGNTNGLFPPCDCSLGRMGGFAKRATLFKQLDRFKNAIILETGGTLDNPEYEQTKQLLNIISRLNYDLILPTENDRKLWEEAFEQKRKEWVGSYGRFTYRRNGIRISIFAISDVFEYDKYRIGIADPDKMYTKDDIDVNGWLVHLPDKEIKKLLELYTKPDFIIAGPCDWAAPTPDTLMGIPVYRAGVDGIDILELDIKLNQKGKASFVPQWHELLPEVEEDSEIKKLVDELN